MAETSTPVSDVPDMRERILQAAEDLLRRHGPAKTKVVDVARHLGMSHANVYRHFNSKADIQDMVAARWLRGIAEPLYCFVAQDSPAEARLRGWVDGLIAVKLDKLASDPELFATYNSLAEASRDVIAEHVSHLREQIAAIVADGVKRREFKVNDISRAARAIHEGTSRFQHPYFVTRGDARPDGVEAVMDLLIAGLKTGVI
ncbi:TetR family transcriptional regulator [Sphingomonas sp. Leaf339]|uniref:TetR family transcriptional regulator n=1 Tax=Sphingomonas sp. Leaf339 TaxID=1736343 RepID=UPI00191021F3|nr:TetR family transcriptional regulator [Sphingomonas sp. Leaf339]